MPAAAHPPAAVEIVGRVLPAPAPAPIPAIAPAPAPAPRNPPVIVDIPATEDDVSSLNKPATRRLLTGLGLSGDDLDIMHAIDGKQLVSLHEDSAILNELSRDGRSIILNALRHHNFGRLSDDQLKERLTRAHAKKSDLDEVSRSVCI